MKRRRTIVILLITVLVLTSGGLFVWNMNRTPSWPEITDELTLYWLKKADTRLPDFRKVEWGKDVHDSYLSVLCMAGDFKRVAARIEDYPARRRDGKWRTVTYSFSNAGHYSQAAEATRRIEDEARRKKFLENLTDGRYTGAWYQNLTDTIEDSWTGTTTGLGSAHLREAAISAATVGDFEQAREILARIVDNRDRENVTEELAFWEGAYKKGRDFARSHKRFDKANVSFYISSMISLGHLEKAETEIELVSNPFARGVHYIGLAANAADHGKQADILRLLNKAEEEVGRLYTTTAPSEQNKDHQPYVHSMIALTLLGSGYATRADEMIERIVRMTEAEHTSSRVNIIQAVLAMGDLDRAIALATDAEGKMVPGLAPLIVGHFAAKRDRQRVDELIEAMESPKVRTELYLGAARTLITVQSYINK